MTRENKLALVVGFALMLLVGILVSDHFSTAQGQEAATLARVADPLAVSPQAPADLIALDGETPGEPSEARAMDPLVSGETLAIEMGRRSPSLAIATPVTGPGTERRHHVRPLESLIAICGTYYGDPSLAPALARHNGLDDPNRVPEGMSLRIPDAETLIRRGDAPPPTPIRAPATPAEEQDATAASYTVVENDSLSRIAQKLLGSGHRWAAIFEANRDQLDSPDEIRAGMILRIPRTTG